MKALKFKSFWLLIVISFTFLFQAAADTTDFYHILYNKDLLKAYPGDTVPISIIRTDIKDSDSLTIKYWSDTPCKSCKFYLVVIDQKKNYVKVVSAIGQSAPLSISVKDIFDWSANELVDNFDLYYYEEKPAYPIHLCKLVFK